MHFRRGIAWREITVFGVACRGHWLLLELPLEEGVDKVLERRGVTFDQRPLRHAEVQHMDQPVVQFVRRARAGPIGE